MNSKLLVFLLLCVFSHLGQTLDVSSTRIENNAESCHLAWFNQRASNQILFWESGPSFPTCPSSYIGSKNEVSGLFCATNVEQNLDVLLVATDNYVIAVSAPPSEQTGFEKILDSTGGNSAIEMYYDVSNANQDLWCAENQAATIWEPKGETDTCYGVPLTSDKLTLCIYTNSECSIDGTCWMDTVSSSITMHPVYPFFDGVYSAPALLYSFVDL